MSATLFLQSEMGDPYAQYENRLRKNPVFWDSQNNFWAIYSYEICREALANPLVSIPLNICNNKEQLNQYSFLIADQLARLSNDPKHEETRDMVFRLLKSKKDIPAKDVLSAIMESETTVKEIDWVEKICRKLPVLLLLKSFHFKEDDCHFIADNIQPLTKIMLPHRSNEQTDAINEISKEIYARIETHILSKADYNEIVTIHSEKYRTGFDAALSLCISNFTGLFIQIYDAAWGMLSNSLLQILCSGPVPGGTLRDDEYFTKSVIETLRFDPPVHNTRRIAIDDIQLGNTKISRGETLFIVLAGANRDPLKFVMPNRYDIDRINNSEHLTFGAGPHRCPGQNFSVKMTSEVLSCLFENYKTIRLLEKEVQYEPVINLRLPKHLFIALS